MASSRIPPDFVRNIFDLRGKRAAITGAGGDLGAAMAIGLAQAGARVELLDINEEGTQEVQEIIEEQGGTGYFSTCDVTNEASVSEIESRIRHERGSIDILVNCAGTAFRCAAEDLPVNEFDRIIELNLKGTFLTAQVFGKSMLAQGSGSIINIASIGGFVAYPLASAYLASKGGVVQLTRSLALEWGPRGVRVNAIGPTLMRSSLEARSSERTSATSDFIEARMLRSRLGLPSELIGAAVFLASEASTLVNGHTLMCDDGYLIA